MIPSVLPTYNRADLTFVSGSGVWLTEADGRRFLDLGAGIAVNALGHAHPALVRVLTEQAGRLWHVSNLYMIPEQEALADALVDATFADTVFFTNSGTEACELAVKMARKYWFEKGQPDRTRILTFEGAFHGRSSAAIAAAGSEKMTKGFAPLLPGFTQLPWGDHDAFRAAIDKTVAAILIEPIQGEGGIRLVPGAFLRGLHELCDRLGLLLVFDEVQTGIGRTGKLFAYEWSGVAPDIMASAKGLGGGFPVGACLATAEAARGMTPGTHGSTFGGNPLAMAVGQAVLDVLLADGFLDEVARKGLYLKQRLASVVDSHPDLVDQVRGEGLLVGVRCKVPVAEVGAAMRDQDLLGVGAGENVIRMLPPLIVSDAEIDEGVRRFEAALEALEQARAG